MDDIACSDLSSSVNTINAIDLYINQLNDNKHNFAKIINDFVKNESISTKFYITGVGKSGHVSQKVVSTWQSIGIKAYFLLLQDLAHGDFGILRDGDVILYLSNSGNTSEIVNVSKYIKTNYNIRQICFTSNNDSYLKDIVDVTYVITESKIKEIDVLNKVPSVSVCLFTIIMDTIGIQFAQKYGFGVDLFRKNHPGGSIGCDMTPPTR